MSRCYLGLGSNLGNPRQEIKDAITHLHSLPKVSVTKTSSFYRSKPMGPKNQNDFINAVIEISTTLNPHQLLALCKTTERQQNRIHYYRWGPRTIDIDLLLFEQLILDSPNLQIPHPGLPHRNFVVFPLHELNSKLILPDGVAIKSLFNELDETDITQLELIELTLSQV